jgi:hypothetical protein
MAGAAADGTAIARTTAPARRSRSAPDILIVSPIIILIAISS